MRYPSNLLKTVIIGCVLIILIVLWKSNSQDNNSDWQHLEDYNRMVKRINYLSEWDSTNQYRITSFPNAIKSDSEVTLVTQGSFNKLPLVHDLVYSWLGPISVAVFCESQHVTQTLRFIVGLRACHKPIADFVTFHLVVFKGNGNVQQETFNSFNCADLSLEVKELSNYALGAKYPVNLLRNTALRGVATTYSMVIDIDMLPSPGLERWFTQLARRRSLGNMTAYIVPAFELEPNAPIPRTKDEVVSWRTENLLRPFYYELCETCQSCVNYKSWFNLPKHEGLDVGYSITWKDPCEPFYIADRHIPLYDESFVQYGFNRISQLCEMYVAGYSMWVLDNAFIVHRGFKVKDNFHASKDQEQEENKLRYREFKIKMRFKYPLSRRRC